MTKHQHSARALTLIEVLLAVALLTILAGVTVGILQDAGISSRMSDSANRIDVSARLVDSAIDKYSNELRILSISQTWTPPLDDTVLDPGLLQFTRQPCDGCPDGWGRLRVSTGDFAFTRFQRFDLNPEDTP